MDLAKQRSYSQVGCGEIIVAPCLFVVFLCLARDGGAVRDRPYMLRPVGLVSAEFIGRAQTTKVRT
jgi:hypothetical protein